jgi:hypothetical protein
VWAERAVRAVNEVFPAPEYSNWLSCDRSIRQAQALAPLIEKYGFDFPEAARLIHQSGYYLNERAQYEEAEPLLVRALAIREKALGAEHPAVATILENYSSLLRATDKESESEKLENRASIIRAKYLHLESKDRNRSEGWLRLNRNQSVSALLTNAPVVQLFLRGNVYNIHELGSYQFASPT